MPRANTEIPWAQLASLSRAELLALGCRAWDDTLMLFPASWYERIPIGLEVVSIRGESFRFANDTDDDRRFGMLSFGVIAT